TRPGARKMMSTASRNASPTRPSRSRSASASIRMTRRARLSSSGPVMAAPASPRTELAPSAPPSCRETAPSVAITSVFMCLFDRLFTRAAVVLHEAVPLAAGLEQRLDELADRAVASGPASLPACERPDLGDRVRDGDGEPDPGKGRQVGQVVADEGDLVPIDAVLRDQPLEGGQLPAGRVLVARDPELLRPDPGRVRGPAADQCDRQPGPYQHSDPEPVGDVELLEFDGASVLRPPDVDAVVGEHAIDVEEDEADSPRQLPRQRLSHRSPHRPSPRPAPARALRGSRGPPRGGGAGARAAACSSRPTARSRDRGGLRERARRRPPRRPRARAEG